jgi:multidrug resistance efflux pump
MKTIYLPSNDQFAINGITAMQIDAEGAEALSKKVKFLDESSKEVQAYKAELEKRQADAAKPKAVTMRQARLALLGAGLLSKINDALKALPSPQKEAATIEWEYSNEVQRNGALVKQLGASLGLDDAALDKLFATAAKL